MNRTLTLLLACFIYGQIQAQETLQKIDFAYTEGYEMKFEGQVAQYDEYNFPTNHKKLSLRYLFHDLDSTSKGLSIKVDVIQTIAEKDTMHFPSTRLVFDNRGMWIVMDKLPNGKKEKHPTRAIALPMEQNMVWDTYYNDKKMISWCQSLDTIIATPYGKLAGFAVVMEGPSDKINGLNTRLRTTECYVPTIGKTSIKAEVYYISPIDGRKFYLNVMNLSLIWTNLPQQTIDSLPVLP